MKPFAQPTALLVLITALALAGCSSADKSAASVTRTEAVAQSTGAGFDETDGEAHVDDRKLKRNAWMTVEVDDEDDIPVTIDKARELARKVQDVLEVEKELSRVTLELERLKGQMRTMKRETTYASFRLSVEEEVTPGPLGWVFYGSYKAVKWLFVWD